MDFDQILMLIITAVIVPLLTWGVAKLTQLADAKIAQVKNETIRKALNAAKDELASAVTTAVTETQQTFVNVIKEDGVLTKEQAHDAFYQSFERTKQIMSNSGMEVIQTATGALNEMITAQIEATLPGIKKTEV